MHQNKRVLLTLSPQQISGTPIYGHVTKMDFHRARRFLNGSYPAPIPELMEWHRIYDKSVLASFNDVPFVVIDTEYNYNNEMERPQDRAIQLTLIGLYGPGTPVLQADWPRLTMGERDLFKAWLRGLIKRQVIVFQNTLADIAVLDKFLGIKFSEYKETHDTMYAHAALWCELPHNLEFLASVYGKHQKLKHLSKENPLLYNAGDVLETSNTWLALEKELSQDPKSKLVYTEYLLPLRHIIYPSERRGIRVNRERVLEVKEELSLRTSAALEIAQAYAGYPINLNSSDQVIQALLADGIKLRSTKADILVDKRNSFLAVEPDENLNEETLLERIDEGAHPLLEARASFIQADKQLSAYINSLFRLDGSIQERVYPHYLPTAQDNGRWSTTNPPLAQLPEHLRDIYIPDMGYPWIGWDWSAIELRILAAMAKDDMLLNAFNYDWDMHSMNATELFGWFNENGRRTYSNLLQGMWREFQSVSISGQDCEVLQSLVSLCKTGELQSLQKWINGLPEDKIEEWIKTLPSPNDRECWPGSGGSSQKWEQVRQYPGQPGSDVQIRARVVACAAWFACGGSPPDWEGKDDKRRVFSKRFVYRIIYGGDPKNAASIPGAKKLGLSGKELVASSYRWLSKHTGLDNLWRRFREGAIKNGEVRSFLGRRRRLLERNLDRRIRQAYDQPMQAGCSDVFNSTIIEVIKTFPSAQFIYGMHDSLKFGVPLDKFEDYVPKILEIGSKTWDIEGTAMRFTITPEIYLAPEEEHLREKLEYLIEDFE